MKTLKLICPPIAGVLLFIAALFTLPIEAAAQGIDLTSPTLLSIPVLGDVLSKVQIWLPVVLQIVGAFAAIAAITANETDDKIVNYVLKAVNFLGMNFGTAKNDPSVGVTQK